jgi:hypothetical protein
MTKAIVTLRHAGESQWKGQPGIREFATLPRIGEAIEVDRDGGPHLYRVVSFHHAAGAPTAGDLFAVHLGPTADVIGDLLNAA